MAENKKKEEQVEKLTKEEAEQIESVFFEDDEEIMLRDGKTYKIHPCTLKDARKLMKLLRTVQIEAIILNFLPEDDGGTGAEKDLFDILLLAFKNYPHVDKDYIDNYVDLETAKQIIEIMIGINGIKKSLTT